MLIYELIEEAIFYPDYDEGFLGAVQKHFEQRIDNIKLILGLRNKNRDVDPEVFILGCCFIDAIAGIFYGEETDIGVRFRKILYDFGNFKNVNFEQVSLIALEKNLDKAQFSQIKNLYKDNISERISKIDYDQPGNSFKYDPLKTDLLTELAHLLKVSERDLRMLKEVIEKSTYASLLYDKYRCPVVHKGMPECHWDMFEKREVHYVGIIDGRADWVFPASFLVDLLEHILKGIFERIPIE